MEDLEEVRRRMQQKKNPKLNDHQFQRFYRFSISMMSLCAMVLVAGCFFKINPEVDVKEWVEEHVLSVIPFPSFMQEMAVDQMIHYELVSENTYVSNDATIYALEDGIVENVTEDSLTIIYQNGIKATYRQLASCHVRAYDHIEQAESLGTYEQAFEMILTKDGNEVAYEEIFA